MKKKFYLPITGRELPLAFWAIGYLEFLWHTIGPARIPLGVVSWSAFLTLAIAVCYSQGKRWWQDLRELEVELKSSPVYIALFFFLACSLALAFLSSLRPPHLPQEYDAIHYQMGVPRQLLIRHTLDWLGWPVADLWPMALQWGMAPYSLAFPTINKVPQFVFSIGLAACLFRLPRQLAPNTKSKLSLTIPMLAILGAQGVMIQLGTAMIDLPLLYFLVLTLSSLLDGRLVTSALALAVFTASKAFNVFQIAPVILGGLGWLWFGRSKIDPRPIFYRFAPLLIIFSVLLLARPAYVALKYTGTPLYPFAACRFMRGEYCSGEKREIIGKSEKALTSTRYWYGLGREPKAFLQHFWRVAVPTNGVNNEYDYPLGLPWLLLMPLLLVALWQGGWRSPLIHLTLLFWALWWLNAHQSRWLYPVMAFGFLGTLSQQQRAQRTLPLLLLVSSLVSLVSQVRSVRPTLGLTFSEIQEAETAKVRWHDDETLDTEDLLYVNYPAPNHTKSNPYWVLR